MTEGVESGQDSRRQLHLPGEEGIWVFIGGDLFIFSTFFVSFMLYRAKDTALFLDSAALLNRGFGLVNTLIMLSSSVFVALAVISARQGLRERAGMLLLAGIACGIGFGILKALEYAAKIRAGITLNTNEFFTFYYMLTGIHMFHVTVATIVLYYLWTCTRSAAPGPNYESVMEAGGIFWHVVDLLWVVLFALLYLLK